MRRSGHDRNDDVGGAGCPCPVDAIDTMTGELVRKKLSSAAEAAGIGDRTARKWLARYRAEGASGWWTGPLLRCWSPTRTEERRFEVIAALRRLRLTGSRSLMPRDGALDGVGDPDPDRDGQARRLGLELAQPINGSGPESSSTLTSRSSGGSRAAPGTHLWRGLGVRPRRDQ